MHKTTLLDQAELLGLALDTANAGVWDFYPATGQVSFSDHWYSMLGYAPGTVEATYAGWIGRLHPDDQVAVDCSLMGYIDAGGQGMFEVEYRMRQADGDYRWMQCKGRSIAWDKHGSPIRLVGLNLDIQKLKDVQEDMLRREVLAKAAFDQTFQLCGLLDTEGRLVEANQRALDFAGINKADVVGKYFWQTPWWLDWPESESFLRQAVETARQGGVVRHEVIHYDAKGNRNHVDFSLSPLTNPDGSVTYLIAEGRNITARRQAELALRESEEKYKAIFNNAPIGIFRSTFDGRLLDANPVLAHMYGYGSVEEFIHGVGNLGHDAYWRPEDRQDLLDALLENPSGTRMSVVLRRLDGSTFLAIINAALHMDVNGAPFFIDGTIEDITERMRMEQALRESEGKYRAIFNNAPVGIFRSTFEGHMVDANPNLAKMLKSTSSQQAMDAFSDIVGGFFRSPEDRQAILDALITSPDGICVEREYELPVGSLFTCIVKASLQNGKQGQPAFIDGIVEDITERRRVEQALCESELKYRTIFNNAPIGIFRSTVGGEVIEVNPTLACMHGFNSAQELLQSVKNLGQQLYRTPEDRLRWVNALRESPAGIRMDIELLRKDGSSFQATINASLHLDESGAPTIIYGTIEDATERRQVRWA